MSLTALAWVALAAGQLVLSIRRPVWMVGFYMQTFFAAPHLWWWGDEIPEARYALWAGIALLGVVVLQRLHAPDTTRRQRTIVELAAVAMVLNATFVHFVLASRPDVSLEDYVELLKFVVLFFIMGAAIRDRRDFRLALITIALGAAYIGYEVTINERGVFSGSRLEGVGAPGAETANGLADLMLVSLPLAGSLFLIPSLTAKAASVITAPLILNVLLLCNSRGAFLGLAGAAVSFLILARQPMRKQALRTLALGGLALFLLLGDPDIAGRFTTTFVGSEERDNSAASRFVFWRAGLLMLQDYPLGAGGGAFKYVHGPNYLGRATGDEDPESRSLHNGYLTEATDWGVQGLLLKLLFMGGAFAAAFRTMNRARRDGRIQDAFLGVSVCVTAAALLIHCLFGSFLASEWTYWVAAILVRYSAVYAEGVPAVLPVAAAPGAATATAPGSGRMAPDRIGVPLAG